jgi:hypothetical protein
MKLPFDPKRGLIVVQAELTGPNGVAVLRLALVLAPPQRW